MMKSPFICNLSISGVALILLVAVSCTNQKQTEPIEVVKVKNVVDVQETLESPASSVYDFKMKNIDGKEVSLSEYKGKVLLFVNVASKCGYTNQYEDIEKFYLSHKDKNVVVLGFPANNFMGQEPGTDSEIKSFCKSKYNVTFPMFSKISVKGDDQHPLYQYLTTKLGQPIKWNFNKILVNKEGLPVKHFASGTSVTDTEFLAELKKLMN